MGAYSGLFVTFEGGEGAGKSTLIAGLWDLFSAKYPVFTTRQPGGSRIGGAIRELLLSKEQGEMSSRCELLLFLADRAQHLDEIILPQLAKGSVVLCDRYNDSTIAYQGAARGFHGDRLHSLCDFATEGVEPDLTFYLDIDPEIGLARLAHSRHNTDRIESETLNFHMAIRQGFLDIAKQKEKSGKFYTIDGSQTQEAVLTQVAEILDGALSSLNR